MRIAALDLGSNTLKMTVAEATSAGDLQVLAEGARTTRIGQGLDAHGRLLPEAMTRTLEGLRDLVEIARAQKAERVACVGTAGLRGAANAPEFLARVKAELDLDVEVIHGDREAELAFRAPAATYGPGPVVVIDVGGRSTEVVVGAGGQIAGRISLELGSVRLTERFIEHDPPQDGELQRVQEYLSKALTAAPEAPGDARLIGVSGTVLSLMGIALDLDDMGEVVARGEGRTLTRAAARAAFEDLRAKTTAQRIRGTVIPPGRADVIVAGALIVLAALERYRKDLMLVSNRGVRYGLLYELLEVASH